MLTSSQKLSAIAWKCDQLDLSYGKLINTYSADEIRRVYDEYEKILREKQAASPIPQRRKPGRKPRAAMAAET